MCILYTTGCPRCGVLSQKLREAGIPFVVCDDRERMRQLGLDYLPVLEVDGRRMEFAEANRWINQTKEAKNEPTD